MTRCALLQVLLLLLSARFAFSGNHSHYFYTTLTYNVSFGLPSYYSTRTIDDITLFRFDIDEGVVERKVPWFKGANRTLLTASINEQRFYRLMNFTLYSIMDFLSYSEGDHILQNLDGCALFNNGTVNIIKKYHFNGKPLMFFNWETGKFMAELPEYEDFVDDWNGNTTMSEKEKNISLSECVPHIQELLQLGKCTLDRKVPVVKVTHIPVGNAGGRLYCRAYGHYPKDIFIMWYKNGHHISEKMMERLTLPLPDMTYLTSLSFNVTSLADDVYTCKVNHSSMLLNFTQDWTTRDFENLNRSPSNPLIGAVIGICLAIILVITIIVFGLVSFAKSRRQ
ncbi:major histocompatibility complex class I-related gene protein-like isoform X2 [Bufo gargarizans]|uniref:major histocompatibility complex class I-related gene protein-like isoform X2 n=1 Tax=Bufo gargarizans TaxID=30331 RepID=UPI001CF3F974|nr:major histocompatibility complex class I-related gene protein-like isoform X2 [Bufo gargarizans]